MNQYHILFNDDTEMTIYINSHFKVYLNNTNVSVTALDYIQNEIDDIVELKVWFTPTSDRSYIVIQYLREEFEQMMR